MGMKVFACEDGLSGQYHSWAFSLEQEAVFWVWEAGLL
jgi:hypothetical protein